MEEQLISFATAKLAKEKGCKVDHNRYYDEKISTVDTFFGNIWKDGFPHNEFIPRPSQSLLQKWLRDIHNIHITISNSLLYNTWHIIELDFIAQGYAAEIEWIEHNSCTSTFINKENGYDTYEETLELALFKSLQIIK